MRVHGTKKDNRSVTSWYNQALARIPTVMIQREKSCFYASRGGIIQNVMNAPSAWPKWGLHSYDWATATRGGEWYESEARRGWVDLMIKAKIDYPLSCWSHVGTRTCLFGGLARKRFLSDCREPFILEKTSPYNFRWLCASTQLERSPLNAATYDIEKIPDTISSGRGWHCILGWIATRWRALQIRIGNFTVEKSGAEFGAGSFLFFF